MSVVALPVRPVIEELQGRTLAFSNAESSILGRSIVSAMSDMASGTELRKASARYINTSREATADVMIPLYWHSLRGGGETKTTWYSGGNLCAIRLDATRSRRKDALAEFSGRVPLRAVECKDFKHMAQTTPVCGLIHAARVKKRAQRRHLTQTRALAGTDAGDDSDRRLAGTTIKHALVHTSLVTLPGYRWRVL